ncbi:hypothetical protein NITUZ_60010 [Candidatus Nitrosotenuis uzonensis]|uniref:Uncharacterized protein n=1 Tax=Candidatus Nitrosotenuis uzonensis TaxID=1407055 RepID=V6AVF4_9ARCH|nr:hypothetical protein NITUZ_60010 [Candidatus Nitrosotenuis uzonensis]
MLSIVLVVMCFFAYWIPYTTTGEGKTKPQVYQSYARKLVVECQR